MENKDFDKILSNIPDYFYPAFAGELVSVFGSEILEPSETGEVPLFYISGTTGWNAALRMTCKKLGIDWLMSWYYKGEPRYAITACEVNFELNEDGTIKEV